MENGKQIQISMHRLIMGLKPGDGKIIDHINHNGLNNRRKNLWICSHSQNCKNRYKPATGIRWDKRLKKWVVCIYVGVCNSKKQAENLANKIIKEIKNECR